MRKNQQRHTLRRTNITCLKTAYFLIISEKLKVLALAAVYIGFCVCVCVCARIFAKLCSLAALFNNMRACLRAKKKFCTRTICLQTSMLVGNALSLLQQTSCLKVLYVLVKLLQFSESFFCFGILIHVSLYCLQLILSVVVVEHFFNFLSELRHMHFFRFSVNSQI